MDAPENARKCRTCKTQAPVLGLHGRCESCNTDFQTWLQGGVHYRPEWDGVLSEPPANPEFSGPLHRALVLQVGRRRGVL